MTGIPFEHVQPLSQAVAALGGPDFPDALRQLCLGACGFDSLFISVFSTDRPPVQLHSDLDPDATRRTVAPYLGFAYLLDPFYGLFASEPRDRVVSLDECAPDDFRESEYYRIFYAETGLRDEIAILVGAGANTSIALSLGLRREDHHADPSGKASLDALLPVISALCRKHWPEVCQVGPPDIQEPVFDRLASMPVSNREAEVIRLMLKGHSTKSIARHLGNSPETVKVHRKRIYSKLKISSQGELFSLLFGQ
ncbi:MULTISPECIES: helix-turn-helix transcriptional regulator [unclassified Ensifer]|uniref:helix-turn-helix transcriptional regulator n=1 Tax=unclassified Ensifer TaxID=2633371 RepID=UPI00137A3165|nr:MULTISPECIES: helix-turn-helix transcriptional regulator [unclassified Ensifer]